MVMKVDFTWWAPSSSRRRHILPGKYVVRMMELTQSDGEGVRIRMQSKNALIPRPLGGARPPNCWCTASKTEGVRYVFASARRGDCRFCSARSQAARKIRSVVTRHEQGRGFHGRRLRPGQPYPGVCLATLGPGATNLITGIADAMLDRAPLVAITGQAGLEVCTRSRTSSWTSVQMLRPITKWNARVEVPETLPEIVRKAFRLARLEKPGATHLELPEDVAAADVPAELAPMPVRRTTYPAPVRPRSGRRRTGSPRRAGRSCWPATA